MGNDKIYNEDTRLSEVSMPTSALHSLLRAGFVTVGDVLAADIDVLCQLRGIGLLTILKIHLELAAHGIKWSISRSHANKTVGNNITAKTLYLIWV